MNQRRLLMLALGASLSCGAALLRAQTSSGSMRRVGVLAPSTPANEEINLKPFFDEMRRLGWVEGQNIAYDRTYANDRQEMLPKLAAELVARAPEVIYAPPTVAAVAAKQATKTIPIVFGLAADPVGTGLVTSLARPGGNVTGISGIGASLGPKRVELLKEILPDMKRLGLLVDPTDPNKKLDQQALAPLVAALGLTIVVAEAANTMDFDVAVARLAENRVDAIYAGGSAISYNMRVRLIELANQKRVPVIASNAQFADAGALFAYGASAADRLRRSALVVDKVLKGAKPADIPVGQPTLFELVVNLKTARALGITIPRSIRMRAERVIEE
jgi:putative tryptophan/tyrosine transport system substrate-binding protein